MLGPGFSLSLLLDTIREVKPRGVALGTHHYVQLSESEILKEANPEDLSEVKLLMPSGAAVPSSCEQAIRQKFKNLLVTTILNNNFEIHNLIFIFLWTS
jgi:hypothetical protein